MSICEKNQTVLDEYILGLCDLEDFDKSHARWCPTCREAYKQSLSLRRHLSDYAAEINRLADQQPVETASVHSISVARVYFRKVVPWAGIAASLVLAFLLGSLYTGSNGTTTPGDLYLQSLEAESGRAQILTYLGRTQIFFLSLFDGAEKCGANATADRNMASALLFQKRLLEPQLLSPELQDIRPLLDEVEFILLEISEGTGCMREGDLLLWKEVLESRSTLLRLSLLQMEGRI
jgi:hypothetical protein